MERENYFMVTMVTMVTMVMVVVVTMNGGDIRKPKKTIEFFFLPRKEEKKVI